MRDTESEKYLEENVRANREEGEGGREKKEQESGVELKSKTKKFAYKLPSIYLLFMAGDMSFGLAPYAFMFSRYLLIFHFRMYLWLVAALLYV